MPAFQWEDQIINVLFLSAIQRELHKLHVAEHSRAAGVQSALMSSLKPDHTAPLHLFLSCFPLLPAPHHLMPSLIPPSHCDWLTVVPAVISQAASEWLSCVRPSGVWECRLCDPVPHAQLCLGSCPSACWGNPTSLTAGQRLHSLSTPISLPPPTLPSGSHSAACK